MAVGIHSRLGSCGLGPFGPGPSLQEAPKPSDHLGVPMLAAHDDGQVAGRNRALGLLQKVAGASPCEDMT